MLLSFDIVDIYEHLPGALSYMSPLLLIMALDTTGILGLIQFTLANR